MTDAARMSAAEIAAAVRAGRMHREDAARACLDRIGTRDGELHAFLHAGIEPPGESSPDGPLAGVPVAVKDNICTRHAPTTCASRILEGWTPPYDATVIERLRRAGAILVGKTNLDEFAMGSSTENSAFGLTRNPWDTARVPGGSSGGSAAAVAAGFAPLALGSDTGGSIRQPAAFCGIVGFKPTYGRVSRYGLVAFASSLDQIGPMARTVRDTALLYSVIAGHDPRDSTSAPLDAETPDLDAPIRGVRVGLPKEYFDEGLDPQVAAGVDAARRALESLGAAVRDVSLPTLRYGIPTYYLVCTSEASSNLARYDGVHYGVRARDATDIYALYARSRARGFGAEVRRRILLGTFALSSGYYDAYYLTALKARRKIWDDFRRVFDDVDLVLGPTTPTPPFRLGEKVSDPLAMYLSDIYTVTANLAGLPAISLPCAISRDGLPIAVQIHGRAFEDARVLSAAAALERRLGLAPLVPPGW
jgi:aspartyl-tRNA(Asn)/glutamyl-tRNA(Gln) amidotransferase subunit A